MAIKRRIARVETPIGHPGFLGAGHTARPVVTGGFSETDPFIMLMDDILDKKDNQPVGGPHPHAGFETVTLLLSGELGTGEDAMREGDFQIMTAGSGIVHTETINKKTKLRLLQLWLNLPKKDRQAIPRLQDLRNEHVPVFKKDGVEIKLYSGSLSGLTSPILNYVPMVIAVISMETGTNTVLEIPANFNAFLYVIDGDLKVGDDKRILEQDQVGWLNLVGNDAASELKLVAGEKSVRLVLYAGKPLGEHIVSHGPFIADSAEDIQRLYQEYRLGKMRHIATVPEEQKMSW
jgi:redox-sensitive bicupin YhaK (pirin superfamily)